MPTPTNTEIIDGIQDAATQVGSAILPKYENVINAGSLAIDIVQQVFQDGSINYKAIVGVVAGGITGVVVGGSLATVTGLATVAAFEIGGPGAALAVFYEGSFATIEITNQAVSLASQAALDALESQTFKEFEDAFRDTVSSVGSSLSSAISAAGGVFAGAAEAASPIVLDMDGDGIELVSLANSQTFFDIDHDQFAELTGWATGDDAFLARDLNGNGAIDNQAELFGDDGGTSAYQKLAALDSLTISYSMIWRNASLFAAAH